MEKRRQHQKHSDEPLAIINIILLIARIVASVFLFIALKESNFIFSTTETRQVPSSSANHTNITTTSPASTMANDNSSTNTSGNGVNWVKQDSNILVLILTYRAVHVMAAGGASSANLIVNPTTFKNYIQRPSGEGYYFLTPEEAYKILTENVLPDGNSKVVWLMFDDSLWDFCSNTYPILQKYGVKTINNVIINTAGNSGNLSLDEVLEMKTDDMSFQDRTITHPDLLASDSTTQTSKMENSRDYPDTSLNQDAIAIAYPARRYSDTTLQVITNLNYRLGLTTDGSTINTSNGLLSLDRIHISPTTTVDSLIVSIS